MMSLYCLMHFKRAAAAAPAAASEAGGKGEAWGAGTKQIVTQLCAPCHIKLQLRAALHLSGHAAVLHGVAGPPSLLLTASD